MNRCEQRLKIRKWFLLPNIVEFKFILFVIRI